MNISEYWVNQLKRKAKKLKKEKSISHIEALNLISQSLGYSIWGDLLKVEKENPGLTFHNSLLKVNNKEVLDNNLNEVVMYIIEQSKKK